MPPILLPVDPCSPTPATIDAVVASLRRGDLALIPTETVYGVAADPRVPGALERIFAAKRRPPEKNIALLAGSIDQVRAAGGAVAGAALKLARRFWPGALTLVVPQGDGWVGYRVPDHQVALEVLRKAGNVLAVSSANRSGEPPAVTVQQALSALGDSVAVALDAGPSPGGVPSTVVKVWGSEFEVLRSGALSAADIRTTVERDG